MNAVVRNAIFSISPGFLQPDGRCEDKECNHSKCVYQAGAYYKTELSSLTFEEVALVAQADAAKSLRSIKSILTFFCAITCTGLAILVIWLIATLGRVL